MITAALGERQASLKLKPAFLQRLLLKARCALPR